MHAQFWEESWDVGGRKTSFHIPYVHEFVKKHMAPEVLRNKDILVPLCGKSVDLLYFAQFASTVIGVELVPKAIESFFSDNNLRPDVKNGVYSYENIKIINDDFLTISPERIGHISMVYDRASLIAFPAEMRADYVRQILRISPFGSKIFLNTLEYEPFMAEPPFSISLNDVAEYYETCYSIEQLEAVNRPSHGLIRAKNLNFVYENLFLIER